MAYAHAEDEPAGVGLAKRLLPGGHGDRVAGVDIGNAGGDDDFLCSSQEQAGVAERLAAERLAEPDGAIA